MRIAASPGPGFEYYSLRWERNFLYLFIVASGFFILFPQVDLAVSRHLFASGVFPASQHPYWIALREFHRLSVWYILGLLVVLLMLYMLWHQPLVRIAPHKLLFITLTFALGPGLLVQTVNLIIGRARPRNLIEFGGLMDFTPAWQLAGMCRHSCSFPSGEAASAAAMLPLLILLPARYRAGVAAVFVPLLVLISFNRVFMGAHFLSDIVIAWTLILGVMLWLWPRILRNADTIDQWVRNKGAGLRRRLYAKAD
ncbi:phosphatase PAP2 family protein [Ochrobactrum sp. Marseille-Q0166]|uniref:phosphatase PAP2 family protein n=1 Tax=Ochrobactrum sp. Marseille-Q0166 TaxID=2761105 RepID=UPI0016567A38|nr:phosphatase PAP2 family protein [Ochrobactrum sp. Marseille-Q0166]MBC8717190.1 phosphatase PAP2 family protein [Ochrobactrum sp. Marseille-Q0166]